MKQKIGLVNFILILMILVILSITTILSEDKRGPDILFGDQEFIYNGEEDRKVLLEQVTAIDKVDGDVTDTLTIENILPLSGGKKANVTYVARDKKNNITKVRKVITYHTSADQESESTNTNQETKAPTTTLAPTPTPIVEGPLVSTGAPQIKLNTYSVTIAVGGYFNYMNYVAEAVDDKDDAWRRISIDGTYHTNIPGEYSIEYSIIDTDGIKSNVEILTLIVE